MQSPNPYGPPGYGPPMYPGMLPVDQSDGGTSVLIWGVLGIAFCQLCAPIAWLKGNAYVQSCQAMGVRPSSAGTAGRVLGMVGTALFALTFVVMIIAFVAGAADH